MYLPGITAVYSTSSIFILFIILLFENVFLLLIYYLFSSESMEYISEHTESK